MTFMDFRKRWPAGSQKKSIPQPVTGKYVVFQNVHEIRRQGDLQELCDLHGIQSFYSLHQGKSFHQHVVHHRLCHRTQQSCNHSTDCSVCSHGHQQVSVLKWKKTSSNVAMSQRLFWDARMYRAECGRIVQFKPVLQTWNGLFMKISNTKLTHSCTNILRVERTLIKHPLGRMHWRNMHAAQQFWMFLVT